MKEYALISAANAGVNVTSVGVDLGDIKDFAIQVVFSSATLNGTLKLQASLNNSDWWDVTGSSQTVTSGAGHMWNVTAANYRYVRVIWTYSSGSGTLTSACILKQNPVTGA